MKRIIVQREKCTECRLCEIVCSLNKYGEVNPGKSRIVIGKEKNNIKTNITVCLQCMEKVCLDGCLPKAISADKKTGAILVNDEKCDACGKCVAACVNQAIRLEGPEGPAQVCDLCGGDPLCAKICPTGAISFEKFEIVTSDLQEKTFERMDKALTFLRQDLPNMACAAACPVGALVPKTEGGLTFVEERCIGCMKCQEICPEEVSDIDHCFFSKNFKAFKEAEA